MILHYDDHDYDGALAYFISTSPSAPYAALCVKSVIALYKQYFHCQEWKPCMCAEILAVNRMPEGNDREKEKRNDFSQLSFFFKTAYGWAG